MDSGGFCAAGRLRRMNQLKRNMRQNLPPRIRLKKRKSARKWRGIFCVSKITSLLPTLCGKFAAAPPALICFDSKKCRARLRQNFRPLQTGRNQTKLTGGQIYSFRTTFDFNLSAHCRDDLQFLFLKFRDNARFYFQMLDVEKLVADKRARFDFVIAQKISASQFRFKVIKINARERLRDVQFARLAVEAGAVPVEHAIRRV